MAIYEGERGIGRTGKRYIVISILLHISMELSKLDWAYMDSSVPAKA